MYAAFNTLQLELERLCLLRESMENSLCGQRELSKLQVLDSKIASHEKAVQLLVRYNQAAPNAENKLHNQRLHKL